MLPLAVEAFKNKPSPGQVAMRQAYRDAGILRDSSKAAEGLTVLTSLGAMVDGEVGTVSVPLQKRGVLILSALEMLSSSRLPPALLRSLLGKLIHALEYRRPLMSLFELSFEFVTQASGPVDGPCSCG